MNRVKVSPSIGSSILAIRLERIARDGIRTANQGNPFWSRADAMRSMNGARSAARLQLGAR
jgi:hypothetical protein